MAAPADKETDEFDRLREGFARLSDKEKRRSLKALRQVLGTRAAEAPPAEGSGSTEESGTDAGPGQRGNTDDKGK